MTIQNKIYFISKIKETMEERLKRMRQQHAEREAREKTAEIRAAEKLRQDIATHLAMSRDQLLAIFQTVIIRLCEHSPELKSKTCDNEDYCKAWLSTLTDTWYGVNKYFKDDLRKAYHDIAVDLETTRKYCADNYRRIACTYGLNKGFLKGTDDYGFTPANYLFLAMRCGDPIVIDLLFDYFTQHNIVVDDFLGNINALLIDGLWDEGLSNYVIDKYVLPDETKLAIRAIAYLKADNVTAFSDLLVFNIESIVTFIIQNFCLLDAGAAQICALLLDRGYGNIEINDDYQFLSLTSLADTYSYPKADLIRKIFFARLPTPTNSDQYRTLYVLLLGYYETTPETDKTKRRWLTGRGVSKSLIMSCEQILNEISPLINKDTVNKWTNYYLEGVTQYRDDMPFLYVNDITLGFYLPFYRIFVNKMLVDTVVKLVRRLVDKNFNPLAYIKLFKTMFMCSNQDPRYITYLNYLFTQLDKDLKILSPPVIYLSYLKYIYRNFCPSDDFTVTVEVAGTTVTANTQPLLLLEDNRESVYNILQLNRSMVLEQSSYIFILPGLSAEDIVNLITNRR